MKFLDFCFVAAVMCAVTNSQPPCLAKFSRFNANHTACLPPPTGNRKPRSEGVSPSNRKYILDMHNYYRGTVHRHGNQPQATNMQKMYWDDELAMVAQKWASNCIWQHDVSSRRSVPGKYPVGQNLAKGHRGWGAVIRHWQSEGRYLDFGKKKLYSNRPIGHYTQMVWAESARLGCGYARCNRTQAFYVCNYGPTGNMVKSRYTPYIAGKTASACPDTASAGLCDCKGKVCYNGGTLDLKTCQCRCPDKQWIRQDGNCSLDCSKAIDSFACGSNGGRWGEEACTKYVNIPFEYCPLMCNLCSSITAGTSALPIFAPTTLAPFLHTTPANTVMPHATQVMPDQNDKHQVGNQRMTPAVNVEEVTTQPHQPSPTPPPAPNKSDPPELADIQEDACEEPREIAKCGQPNSRGYYNPDYCPFGLGYYCPAMCGKCTVTECVDYEDHKYIVGDVWMNEYGEIRCTSHGVKVRRGCYIEKAAIVIDEGDEHSYTDGNINWMCTCKVGYSLTCKGVWSPAGKEPQ